MNKDLAKLLEGKSDPVEVAKIVSAYTKRTARKRNVAEERRIWFHNIIGNVRKVSASQVEALVYEYCMDNDCSWTFSEWLHNRYPTLFEPVKRADAVEPEESDH